MTKQHGIITSIHIMFVIIVDDMGFISGVEKNPALCF
jgi:hypothetical protein